MPKSLSGSAPAVPRRQSSFLQALPLRSSPSLEVSLAGSALHAIAQASPSGSDHSCWSVRTSLSEVLPAMPLFPVAQPGACQARGTGPCRDPTCMDCIVTGLSFLDVFAPSSSARDTGVAKSDWRFPQRNARARESASTMPASSHSSSESASSDEDESDVTPTPSPHVSPKSQPLEFASRRRALSALREESEPVSPAVLLALSARRAGHGTALATQTPPPMMRLDELPAKNLPETCRNLNTALALGSPFQSAPMRSALPSTPAAFGMQSNSSARLSSPVHVKAPSLRTVAASVSGPSPGKPFFDSLSPPRFAASPYSTASSSAVSRALLARRRDTTPSPSARYNPSIFSASSAGDSPVAGRAFRPLPAQAPYPKAPLPAPPHGEGTRPPARPVSVPTPERGAEADISDANDTPMHERIERDESPDVPLVAQRMHALVHASAMLQRERNEAASRKLAASAEVSDYGAQAKRKRTAAQLLRTSTDSDARDTPAFPSPTRPRSSTIDELMRQCMTDADGEPAMPRLSYASDSVFVHNATGPVLPRDSTSQRPRLPSTAPSVDAAGIALCGAPRPRPSRILGRVRSSLLRNSFQSSSLPLKRRASQAGAGSGQLERVESPEVFVISAASSIRSSVYESDDSDDLEMEAPEARSGISLQSALCLTPPMEERSGISLQSALCLTPPTPAIAAWASSTFTPPSIDHAQPHVSMSDLAVVASTLVQLGVERSAALAAERASAAPSAPRDSLSFSGLARRASAPLRELASRQRTSEDGEDGREAPSSHTLSRAFSSINLGAKRRKHLDERRAASHDEPRVMHVSIPTLVSSSASFAALKCQPLASASAADVEALHAFASSSSAAAPEEYTDREDAFLDLSDETPTSSPSLSRSPRTPTVPDYRMSSATTPAAISQDDAALLRAFYERDSPMQTERQNAHLTPPPQQRPGTSCSGSSASSASTSSPATPREGFSPRRASARPRIDDEALAPETAGLLAAFWQADAADPDTEHLDSCADAPDSCATSPATSHASPPPRPSGRCGTYFLGPASVTDSPTLGHLAAPWTAPAPHEKLCVSSIAFPRLGAYWADGRSPSLAAPPTPDCSVEQKTHQQPKVPMGAGVASLKARLGLS